MNNLQFNPYFCKRTTTISLPGFSNPAAEAWRATLPGDHPTLLLSIFSILNFLL
ncbi:MAG: hypothetical protein SPE09_06270 [Alloprevotella sp.]|nr:hypothetical protein [Alloprevotella sp.]